MEYLGGKKMKMMVIFIWFICIWSSSSASTMEFESNLRNYSHDDQDIGLISGPNGYCMQVKNAAYFAGTDIILSPCESTSSFLWKLSSNGTLRVLTNSCLSTSSFTQGSLIFIDHCVNGISWELKKDGQIVNKESKLVLTAVSGKNGTVLSLEAYVYSSFQTWNYNYEEEFPRVVTIAWFGVDQCMELQIVTSGKNKVRLAKCNGTSDEKQLWYLYPDGTVRNFMNTDSCLAYDRNFGKIQIFSVTCGLVPSIQLWVLTDSNAFWNPRSNLVMQIDLLNNMGIMLSDFSPESPIQKWDVSTVSFKSNLQI